MGVPAFFAWLSKRYPKIVKKAREERVRILCTASRPVTPFLPDSTPLTTRCTQPRVINGHQIPIDVSSSNPNGIEFDNLYVDMNNIVHPCCHPEGQAQPPTEGHMMLDIFKYMDRLMSTVRPRRLVYLAIDGVAPRAKMNQQRSRRFRAAQESAEKAEKVAARLKEMVAAGMKIPTATDPFDSNSITPGTEFMGRLSEALQYYVLGGMPSSESTFAIVCPLPPPLPRMPLRALLRALVRPFARRLCLTLDAAGHRRQDQ